MSNSSLSENISINNDPDTPTHPLTPPPSPLSPAEKPIARSEATESNDPSDENEIPNETDTQAESQTNENVSFASCKMDLYN